jgi:CheY-like chemotaxis protein
MDARMPGMDGLKASSIIRDEFSSSTLTIIGTSATHSAEDSLLYHTAGINAFLPKPFTENMLLNVILSVMDNHSETENDVQQEKETEDSMTGNTLDLTNLYHLANNDALFVKQLLTSFIESTENGLIGLQEAVDSNNIEAIGEMAHKISSPCKHVGAYSLYSRLKMIEEQARNNENIGILAKLSGECQDDFLEIKEGLQKHLETI